MNLAAAALVFAALGPTTRADVVPAWVLPGILAVETASHYRDGEIVYINRRRTRAAGPFQIEWAAWSQVKERGERYVRLRVDADLGEDVATRYLLWLNRYFANGDWLITVARYHVGPHGSITSPRATDYATRVHNAGLAATGGRQ